MRKLLVAWIACFAVMLLLSLGFNTVLVRAFVSSGITSALLRSEPAMVLILAGYLLLALLMTLLYPRIVPAYRYSLVTGLLFGAAAGVVWMLPYNLVLHGAYHYPFNALLLDSGWALLEQGCGGAVIGVVHAKKVYRS